MDQFLTALRGPQQQQQVTVADTLNKLADRCQQSTQLADRRAAVLALRGLSRDYKQQVGIVALNALLTVLEHDAGVDEETAKAVLQTINTLCEVDTEIPSKADREAALAHTDTILAKPTYTQKLLSLIQHDAFYVRLGAIHLLNTLLSNRRAAVQAHFVNAPESSRIVIALLEEKRDVIRTEGLQLFQSLTTQNTDIQSIFAFGGSIETLLRIIAQEGGVEGGITAYSCLTAIDGLLRFNISTQNYFRELLPALPPLLLFPPTITPDQDTPQEFALQFWDAQKTQNVSVVVGLIGMLKASEHIRLLTELGIASNAPTIIKTQALQFLSGFNQLPQLQRHVIPYVPVSGTNGEEWDRLEPLHGIDLLVSTILDSEYGGVASTTGGLGKEDMELRTVALTVFEDYVKDEVVATELLGNMIPTSNNASPTSAARLILSALSTLPSSPLSPVTAARLQFACLLFSSLFRGPPNHSTTSPKAIARGLGSSPVSAPAGGGQFFVPADGGPPTSLAPEEAEDEPPSSLLQLLTEHLSLSMLARGRAGEYEGEVRAWDRVVVGYLVLLCTWLWEDQKGVRVFLEGGGIGVLVEPISQTSGIDTLVQGLCALLFGICYHFNREIEGEITRQTLYSIIARLGADQLVARMTRVRDDERFRYITPESIVLPSPLAATVRSQSDSGGEIWLDWGFVEFWKSSYYTVQKGLSTDPDAVLSNNADATELQTIISSLREVLRSQTGEVSYLKKQLAETKTADPVVAERETKRQTQLEQLNREREEEKDALQREISTLSTELSELREKKKEQEKEQEDLLVFLEEMSEKRKRDKAKMRTAGLEVSEDEAEADEDDDE